MVNMWGNSSKLLLGCAMAAALFVPAASAGPAGLKVVYSFCSQAHCPDGSEPIAGLISDSAGNLYGTTEGGGTHGAGTIFKLTPGGTETVLYNFCAQASCADGQNPQQGLTIDSSGNLYGTTGFGGNTTGACSDGACGVVFKLAPGGTYTVLHQFTGGSDGRFPQGAPVVDSSGNVYGTTQQGGNNCDFPTGCGTVYEVASDGSESVRYNFCSDGSCVDGAFPASNLIIDSDGDLYGTTSGGGNPGCGGNGCGVLFELSPGGEETVRYIFCSQANCSDGAGPIAGVIMDSAGNLYGTTQGGNGTGCLGGEGCGVVYKLAPDNTETVLYAFSGGADGAQPSSGLVMGRAGDLFGIAAGGSSGNGSCFNGCGVAYEVTQGGTETVLHEFCTTDCKDGKQPVDIGSIAIDQNGVLYGTASASGPRNFGDVFSITRVGLGHPISTGHKQH